MVKINTVQKILLAYPENAIQEHLTGLAVKG